MVARQPGEKATHDVDQGNDKARDRVAAHELAGAVHGAEELDLTFQARPAGACLAVVDDPGGQIGIDGHLLAGQGVQGETGSNLGHAAGTAGDDHEIHHQEDEKDHRAHDEAATHGELPEGLDDVARGARPRRALQEDEAGGGHVEAQPEQGHDQQQGREDRKVEGTSHTKRHQQHQQRHADTDSQQAIERKWRQGQKQEGDHAQHGQREQKIAARSRLRAGSGRRGSRTHAAPRAARTWAAPLRPSTR